MEDPNTLSRELVLLWLRPLALGLLVLVLVFLYGSAAWLWFRQESLLFQPSQLAADYRLATEADVHEVAVDVPGARLSALHLRLPNPKGVVFFLHGNGGDLSTWFVNTALYRRANFDLFMIDYRGYGKSTGRIESEAQLRADVRAAWDQIAPAYQGKRVVVYGRSLGTGLAAGLSLDLAGQTPGQPRPDLTVLVSPYRSMVALTHDHYPWVPSVLLRYPLRTDEIIVRISSPLLLIHGDSDTLIAPRHSAELAALVPGARLLMIEGAAHNDVHDSDIYRAGFGAALAAL